MTRPIRAKDHMSRTSVVFHAEMEIQAAMHLLLENNVPGGPVVDNLGNLVGVLTERDCLEAALSASYYEEQGGRVSEFMASDVATVDADANIIDVAREFIRRPYRYFPVMKDNRVVGHIGRREVLKALELLRDEDF